jgi:ATP-dependent DNA ligase
MKPLQVTDKVFSTLDMNKYILEPVYDGHRSLLIVTTNGAMLVTSENRPITIPNSIRSIIEALELSEGTVLDGEIWNETSLTFWDCIRNGYDDLSSKPLTERRHVLEAICTKHPDVLIPQHDSVPEILTHYQKLAEQYKAAAQWRSGYVSGNNIPMIHGVIIKRKASPRRDRAIKSYEHADWLKIKFTI